MRVLVFAAAWLAASPAGAATRVRTVEFNLGGYYSATNLNSGTQFTFPTRTVQLPESGKTIRSAYLDYEGLTSDNSNVAPLTLYFNAGSVASTARFTSGGTYFANPTGESVKLHARADVTAVVSAEVANLAAGRLFTGGVAVSGPGSNMHSMKLVITYEYDDASATQVKTVKFPLRSQANVASFTLPQTGGASLDYNAEIPESGATILQAFFEVTGYRLARAGQAATDGSILARVGSSAVEPTMTLDNGLIDSYQFRYLSSSTIPAGFALNTSQTLNLTIGNDTIHTLGGEAVVTYTYSNASPTKSATVRYFLGTTTGAANGAFAAPLFLGESGVTLKAVYARVLGSFDQANADNLIVDSAIGATSVPQRSFSLRSNALQVSGFQYFHDFTAALAGWSNGAVVTATATVPNGAGATGMELIATYHYTGEASYTASYDLHGGLKTTGTGNHFNSSETTYFPESTGLKTLRGAWVDNAMIKNLPGNSAEDFTTTSNINDQSTTTYQHRTTIENTVVYWLYNDDGSQISPVGGAVALNSSVSGGGTAGVFSRRLNVTYTYFPPPNAAAALAQFKSDGASALAAGDWTSQSAAALQGELSSPGAADSLALIVELKPVGTAFDGANLSTSGFLAYSGSAVSTQVVVTGLSGGTSYHWRARTLGNGGVSAWTAFGDNPAGDGTTDGAPANRDVGFDQAAPGAPAMAAVSPADGASLNTSTAALSWEAVTDSGGSGLAGYSVEVATSTDFTTIAFSSAPSGPSALASSLSENVYYWRVRSSDTAGNFGVLSATRSFRVDRSSPVVSVGPGLSGGDLTWRAADPGAVFDADFTDAGGSLLNRLQYKIHSAPNQGGTLLLDYVDLAAPPVDAASFTADWSVNFASMTEAATNYITIRAFDKAGNVSTGTVDAFFVRKDTTAPSIPAPASPAEGAMYMGTGVHFDWSDSTDSKSGVSTYNLQIATAAVFTTITIDHVSTLSSAAISGLAENPYFWRVRSRDAAGSYSSFSAARSLIVDLSSPTASVGALLVGGDGLWRRAAGTVYDVDFNDPGGSLVNRVQYKVHSAINLGGTVVIDWTDIAPPPIGAASYNADWTVDFDSLSGLSTYYVSVRVTDQAGNASGALIDAFFIQKDTTPPSIQDGQDGDFAWRSGDPGAIFAVSFQDEADGSGLSKFQTRIMTGPGQTGALVEDWTDRVSGINAPSYSSPWAAPFDVLFGSKQYVSVRAVDRAGSTTTLSDAFFVLKDTVAPTITNNSPAFFDSSTRSVNNQVYDVDFFDGGGSLLSQFQTRVSTGPNMTGTLIQDWTTAASGLNIGTFTANWSLLNVTFDLMGAGTNYVSVRVFDNAGISRISTDVFKVIKAAPTIDITNNEPAAASLLWRRANTKLYNVDFSADSDLDRFQVRASTIQNGVGVSLTPWTTVQQAISGTSYSSDWLLPAAVFDALLPDASNFISIKVITDLGAEATMTDAFTVKKDTIAPTSINGLAGGDLTWRASSSTAYNFDLQDAGGSLLSGFQVRSTTGPGGSGTLSFDWTDAALGLDAAQFAQDWTLPAGAFELLAQGTNYVSVRFWDVAGTTTTEADAFVVLKDTTVPIVTSNVGSSWDPIWRRASGALNDIDFSDAGGSKLSHVRIKVMTGAGQSGETVSDWTDALSIAGAPSYSTDWSVPGPIWDLMPSGTNYVSVLAVDIAGSSSTVAVDAFKVLKDTAAPVFVNGESGGDTAWRNTPRSYNLDVIDPLSSLYTLQYSVSTTAAAGDASWIGWTAVALAAHATSYAADWGVDFDALKEGIDNFVSVRAWDAAGSTATLTDAFFVRKDTTPPSVSDLQAGEAFWRSAGNGLYNVDFGDAGGSLLDRFQVRATTGPGGSGTLQADWTDVQTAIGAGAYSADWSLTAGVFSALLDSATNWISVRVYDVAGSSIGVTDAFTVLKDTTPPAISDLQAGDLQWRAAGGTAYNVDFEDPGSKVYSAEYKVMTGAGQTGMLVKDWTTIAAGVNAAAYSTDWTVDFSTLAPGVNYVSVRSSDVVGNVSSLSDAFEIRKDTVAPRIVDLQAGDTTWYSADPGMIFNVDFDDDGVGVSSASYEAWTLPGRSGVNVVASSSIFSIPSAPSYTAAWGVNFGLLQSGTSYISVTSYDELGSTRLSTDVFYVQKDTTAPSALTDLSASTPTTVADEGRLTVRFSAPGGDGLIGQASYYMIRYRAASNFAGQADFDAAAVHVSTISPKAAGGSESLQITGLVAGNTYYVAIEAVDRAGNQAALSNLTNNSARAGLDLTLPGATTDFTAVTGGFQGQLTLRWTAPGDGVAGSTTSGSAASYLVRYATFALNSGNLSAANVSTYTQTWTPQPFGSFEEQTMQGLTPGATYHVVLKAIDEAGNVSLISNSTSARAGAAGAADGMSLQGDGANADVRYRLWTPPTWGGQFPGANAAATIRWIVAKSVPTLRNQKIAAIMNSTTTLKILLWDGQSSSWSDITPSPAPVVSTNTKRAFDMAFEHNTGRALIAYNNSSAGAITYAIWSSTAGVWSVGPTNLTLSGLSGPIQWVRLKPRTGTDELIVAALDANADLTAAHWNGSAWDVNSNLSTTVSIAADEAFDISWETLSGRALILWGTGTTTNYSIWNGTVFGGAQAGPNIGGTANWIRLASDPTTNRIGLTSLDGGSDWNVAVWNDSCNANQWLAMPAEDSAMSGNVTRQTDAAWQTSSGQLLVVAVDATNTQFDYITWTSTCAGGGGWSAAPSAAPANGNTTWSGTIRWLSLTPDPNTNNITAYGISANRQVRSTIWNGSAWSASGATDNFLHSSNVSDPNYESADIIFDRHDTVPPVVSANQTGDNSWRNSNSGAYNVDVNDSGGSKVSRLQTRVHTAASLGGTMIQDWTDQVSGINLDAYATDWPLATGTFNLLPPGQSYVSVRAYDGVGNVSSVATDAFYVRKDTSAPAFANGEAGGDSTWRAVAKAGDYDLDFIDAGGSQLHTVQFSVSTSPGTGDGSTLGWTTIGASIGADSYTANWAPDFNLLAANTSYVSVRVWDAAGSTSVLVDAFRVLKDTSAPGGTADLNAKTGTIRGTIILEWTAPGDNGIQDQNSGGGYLVRYSTEAAITNIGLFNAATPYVQAMIPAVPGSLESLTLTDLTIGTTYYFAMRAVDKAGNLSGVSNSTSSLPRAENVFINEIFAAGTPSANDWIELFNNTQTTFSLTGWTLTYNQGSIDSPGSESTVWTGTSEQIYPSSFVVIVPSADLSGGQSHHLILKNELGVTADRMQWPALASGVSSARIADGEADFFEADPTPTRGLANATSTDTIKINEVSYGALGEEFVELYNAGGSARVLTGWLLRNVNGSTFTFTRTVPAGGLNGLDSSSLDANGLSWAGAFGGSGLAAAGDFLALENASGQVIDRVLWQSGAAYSVRNYKAALAPFSTPAPGALGGGLSAGRNEDGLDTGSDSSDFSGQPQTLGGKNAAGTLPAANSVAYPADLAYLPRRFKVEFTLGADSTAGGSDAVWFTRSGGLADGGSPHVYRLSDLSVDLSSTGAQRVLMIGATTNDLDGRPLVDGAVYKVMFHTDTGSGRAAPIERTGVTYVGALSTLTIVSAALERVNQGKKTAFARIEVKSGGPAGAGGLELSTVTVRLTDGAGTALTTVQAQNLFKSLALVEDALGNDTTGLYHANVDTVTLVSLSSNAFSLSSGRQILTVADPNGSSARTGAAATKYFFVVAHWTDDAAAQTPKGGAVEIDADADVLVREQYSDVVQLVSATAAVTTSSSTAIAPPAPPAGTWPQTLGGEEASVEGGFTINDAADTTFAGSNDGRLVALNNDGTVKWTYTTNPAGAVRTFPTVQNEGSQDFVYFANDQGDIYKVRDNGGAASLVWKRDLSGVFRSAPVLNGATMYIGAADGKMYKINANTGLDIAGWSQPDLGAFSATPYIDEFTPGVNSIWIGAQNGTMYRLGTDDGTVSTSTGTATAIIRATPNLDSGIGLDSWNSHYLFWGADDGILRARTSANLATIPVGWTDFVASPAMPILSSPFINRNEVPKGIYFGCDNGKIYKVHGLTGALVWEYQTGGPVRTSPIVLPAGWTGAGADYVYFGSDDGFVYALNAATGAMRPNWPVALGGPVRSGPTFDSDTLTVTVGAMDGTVMRLQVGP